MNYQQIEAELEFLEWRDDQLSAVHEQLRAAFPMLVTNLEKMVQQADRLTLVRSTLSLRSSAEVLIREWSDEQTKIACERAAERLDIVLEQHGGSLDLAPDLNDNFSRALPAVAGLGLMAGSMAAIPAAVSFATITTGGIFGLFATSTVSVPLLTVGMVGVGIASLTGSNLVRRSFERARENLRRRLIVEVEKQVLGIGAPLGARCLLNDISAAILIAGENRRRSDH